MVGILSMMAAGCLGAVLMLVVLGLGIICYICKERRTREVLRDKERDIVKRKASTTNTAIRGQK